MAEDLDLAEGYRMTGDYTRKGHYKRKEGYGRLDDPRDQNYPVGMNLSDAANVVQVRGEQGGLWTRSRAASQASISRVEVSIPQARGRNTASAPTRRVTRSRGRK